MAKLTVRRSKKFVVNPQKPKPRKRHRRKNPVVLAGPINPEKRKEKKTMARKRRTSAKRSHSRRTYRRKAAARNPVVILNAPRRARAKRRNPSPFRRKARRNPSVRKVARSVESRMMKLGRLALGAGVGYFGAEQIPQALLPAQNVGVKGYLMNAITTVGLGMLAASIGSKEDSIAVMAGGAFKTAQRIYSETQTVAGSSMGALAARHQLGDAQACDQNSLGRIVRAYMPDQQVHGPDGTPLINDAVYDTAMVAARNVAAPVLSRMSGVRR